MHTMSCIIGVCRSDLTTVRTKLAFNPRHRPNRPSSRRISLVVSNSDCPVLCSCCRVATTDTGIVKTWPSAPASAPSINSALLITQYVSSYGL